MHMPTASHLLKAFQETSHHTSSVLFVFTSTLIKSLHGSALICGGTRVFCFDHDPASMLFYDPILLLIFAACPSEFSSLKQPFYFVMVLWTSKGLTGKFLPGVFNGCHHLKAQLCSLPRWHMCMPISDVGC